MLKHVTIIEGIGKQSQEPYYQYYKVKNSYGTQFADNGYMRIEINCMIGAKDQD